MKFRSLDSNNDWLWGKGINSYAQANQAIGLDIKTALQSWVNDCFFAQNDFINWAARLDVNQFDNLKNEIYSVISTRNGVNAVKSLNVKMVGRRFTASYDIITIYSTLQDIFSL